MNFEQLLYIIELEKTKTLTQAADNLNISQSGLSQSINHLEEEIGLKLFNRTRQGTIVTKEGKIFIGQAKNILNDVYELNQTAKKLQKNEDSSLKIGVTNEIPASLLEKLLEFQQNNADFKVQITEELSKDIIRGVENEEFDIGLIIVNRDNLSLIQNLNFHKIKDGELRLYMPQEHYLAESKTPISIDLFKEQEFVLFHDEYIDSFIHRFERLYGPLNITLRTTSLSVLFEFMKKLNTVSLVRDFQFEDNLLKISRNEIVSKSIQHISDEYYSYGWVKRKGREFSSDYNDFIKEVIE